MDDELERYHREQASAYMKRIRDARRHIAALNAEIEEHRAMASGLQGIDYSRVLVKTSPSADAIPDAVARLLDVIGERVELVREYTMMLEECGRALTELDGTYADILRYRYVCDYSWEQIACKVNFTEAYCYELHGQALVAFYDHMPAHERDPVQRAI